MLGRRLLLLVVAAAFGVAFLSPSAARAQPCYERVIQDWASSDNKITDHYSPRCLRQAMKHAPEDLRDYTSILDDINAALLAALGGGHTSNGGNNGPGSGGAQGSGTATGSGSAANPSQTIGPKAKKAVRNAGTPGSVPGESREIPLPLILLAAVLGAAALAAGSPALIKRFRSRSPGLKPAPGSVRPPA